MRQILKGENTLLLISLNLHILLKPNQIIAQHELYFAPFVKVQEQNGKFQSFSLLISKCLELESYVSKRLLCYPCVPAGCQVASTAADDSVGPSLFTVLEVFISITFLCMLGTTLAFPQTPVRVNKV